MSRVLIALTVVVVVIRQPVGAQQMMRMLERGPVGYLHGQTLAQQTGDLTAGDFSHPAAADWDGDGRVDIVAGSGYGDLLVFAAGDAGLFEPCQALLPESEVRLDAVPRRSQVSPWVGDLDGDGGLDLLLGLDDRLYHYAVTDGVPGAGTALVGGPDLPRLTGPISPCVMDGDGDGAPDLVMADGNGRLWLLPLRNDAGIECRALAAAGSPIIMTPPARPCASDWDGDGHQDLLIGDGEGRVTLFRGDATGLSAPEVLGGADVKWLPGGIAARAVAPWAVDWDRDGDTDLLLGCRRGFVALVERLGPTQLRVAGFLQQTAAPVDAGRCAVAAPGDWDGDGDVDLVVGGEDGYVTLFERLPGAGIVLARGKRIADDHGLVRAAAASDEYLRYASPALTDWDADGDLDLLVGCGSGALLAWDNSRGLHPLGSVRVSGAALSVDGIVYPAPWDANGDGDADLFLGVRELPGQSAASEVGTPRMSPACAYFENITNAIGTSPRFVKGVPVAMSLVSAGDPPLRRDADFMSPYAIWPARWRTGSSDFIVATAHGTFAFVNTARRGAYARLELSCLGRSLPSPLLPPLFSSRPVELVAGETGLLASDEAYGFVCYYPRRLFP